VYILDVTYGALAGLDSIEEIRPEFLYILVVWLV